VIGSAGILIRAGGEAGEGSATVLARKGKVGIFEEVVGEDDELAHEHGEGEFFGFAGGEQAEVKGFEDGCGGR
jgi:hypothetical protein